MSLQKPETNVPLFNRDPSDGGPGYHKAEPSNWDALGSYGKPEFQIDPVAEDTLVRLRKVLGGKAIPVSEIDKSVYQIPVEHIQADTAESPVSDVSEPAQDDTLPSPADERVRDPIDGTFDF